MFSFASILRPLLPLLFLGILVGCGERASDQSTPKKMVYFDIATMQPFVYDVVTSFPATHPKTGKSTLRPALFCPTCQKWYPVPPPEAINRTPGGGKCPKDKTTMITDGPWPE